MEKPLLHTFMVIILYSVHTKCSNVANMQCSSTYKSLGYIGHSHFFYIDKKVDWHEANRTCHSFPNAHLATFLDEYMLSTITDRAVPLFGRVGEISSFWFGAHDVKFDKWRWLDNQIYEGDMRDYGGNTKKTCGFVNGTEVDHLAYGTCTSDTQFLCVNPDAEVSRLGSDDYYISATAEAVTWFRAREICLCRGMDLAMAKEGSVDYIYTLLNGSAKRFWIGLQKARFVWENTGDAISFLPFRPNQPDDSASIEDCLHVYESGYNDIPCTSKYAFVCERESTSNLPGSAVPPDVARHNDQSEPAKRKEEEKPQKGNAGIIAAVVISVIVVVVVCAVSVALLLRRFHRRGDTGNRWLRFRANREDEGM